MTFDCLFVSSQRGACRRRRGGLTARFPRSAADSPASRSDWAWRLIDRSTRHFALTEEGSRLQERAVRILADIDEAEAEISAKVASPQGHIRIGAPLEIGRRQLAPLIAEFTRQYPRITVELSLNDAIADVLGDDCDVALHIDQPLDGNIISRKIISSRRTVCASPDYLAKRGTPLNPADLLQHDCICLVRGRHIFDCWPFSIQGKVEELQVRSTLLTNHGEVLHDWALLGHGVALKAHWDIEDDLRTGRLVELLAPFTASEINLYVIYPTRTHLPPRVRVFIDFMLASLEQKAGAQR